MGRKLGTRLGSAYYTPHFSMERSLGTRLGATSNILLKDKCVVLPVHMVLPVHIVLQVHMVQLNKGEKDHAGLP